MQISVSFNKKQAPLWPLMNNGGIIVYVNEKATLAMFGRVTKRTAHY